MTDVVVRTAVEADLDAVLRIGHEAWRATYTPIAGADYVERGLAGWWTPESNLPWVREGRVLVAEVDGDLLAMAQSEVVDDHVWLYRLYVLPEAQGRGLGTRLLEVVAASAPEGVTTIRLSYLEGNEAARAFYERHGFVATGDRRPSTIDGPDDLVMERALRSF